MISGKNCGHVPSDVESDHFLSGVSKGLTHVAGNVENFASFFDKVYVN